MLKAASRQLASHHSSIITQYDKPLQLGSVHTVYTVSLGIDYCYIMALVAYMQKNVNSDNESKSKSRSVLPVNNVGRMSSYAAKVPSVKAPNRSYVLT